MKCSTLVFILSLYASQAFSQTYSFVVSPLQTQEDAQNHIQAIMSHTSRLPKGDKAYILDGQSGQVLAQLTSHGARRTRAFLAKNRVGLVQLKAFAKAAHLPAGRIAGSLHLPRLVMALAQLPSKERLHVVLQGAPLFDEPSELAVSMAGGLIPSDGHLNVNRLQSPYGLKGQENWLTAIQVHWSFARATAFQNEAHSYAVHRFWTLYFEGMGAKLVSFGSDIPTILDRAKREATALPHSFKRSPSTKQTMMRLQALEAPVEPGLIDNSSTVAEFNSAHSKIRSIGLRWQCECDIDLWVLHSEGTKPLYYGHDQNAIGQLIKDIRHAPQSSGGFETIRFTRPVNVGQLKIALNYYAGAAPADGVHGEIRITTQERLITKPFHIKAKTGNKGKGVASALRKGQSTSLHTLLIDPLVIIAKRSEL